MDKNGEEVDHKALADEVIGQPESLQERRHFTQIVRKIQRALKAHIVSLGKKMKVVNQTSSICTERGFHCRTLVCAPARTVATQNIQ
jgi:hypothetical protein